MTSVLADGAARMLIIDQTQVPALLPMGECMSVMSDALASLARGAVVAPLRQLMRLPEDLGILGMMPAYMEQPKSFGLKVITVFNRNHGTEYDSHQGVVLLFEAEHGSPIAMIDASSVTAIRTAAVSGVATRLLAREDASTLCIIGSGVQARTHLEAMLLARPIARVRTWSPNAEHATSFAKDAERRHGISVQAATNARAAVDGADIICTVTSSKKPVLLGEWIAPGTHINAVGSSSAAARELDSEAVRRARLFVDRRESALNEAGDFLIPMREGVVGAEHICAEIGELLVAGQSGRRSAEEITLFKSLGLAVEDVAAAHHIYLAATQRGVGLKIDLGGKR